MTPQEKAEELVNKFYWCETIHNTSIIDSKQYALIAVDEIMKAVGWEKMKLWVDRDNYWNEVKQEI